MVRGNVMALTVWSVNERPNQTSVVGVREIRAILEKHADSAVALSAMASSGLVCDDPGEAACSVTRIIAMGDTGEAMTLNTELHSALKALRSRRRLFGLCYARGQYLRHGCRDP